jgi:hypothetical protein
MLLCIGVLGFSLYSYLNQQNAVTQKRLAIPLVAKQIKDLKEANTCLQYEIDLFESPEHLMELAAKSEFAHLKQPLLKEILAMQEGVALQGGAEEVETKLSTASRFRLALGAKP